jgi:tetratricopeptide (TPR) repeat protein
MLGQLPLALPHLERAVVLAPGVADHHYNLGIALAQDKHYEPALAAFRKALALAPDHAGAHHNLAHTLINQGAFEEALRELEHAIALQPDFAESHYLVALALAQMPPDPAREQRARAEIARALALEPKHAGAHHVLGLLELRAGNAAGAIAPLRAATELSPDWPPPYYALGTALVRAGQKDEGAKMLAFFADLERFQRSLETIDRLIALNPRSPAYHFRAAELFLERGKTREAHQALAIVLQLDPNHADALRELGALLLEEKQPREAEALLSRALKASPDDVRAHVFHARALVALGRTSEAEAQLRACAAAHAQEPLPHYDLAQVLEKLGRADEARAERARYEALLHPGGK